MDAVLFDLFGTLVPNVRVRAYHDTVQDIARVLRVEPALIREQMNRLRPERMRGEIPDGPRHFVRHVRALGLDADDDALDAAARRWRALIEGDFEPKPGAVDVVRRIAERGLALGLVTDCSTATKSLFEQSALAPHFGACAYSAHLGTEKPDPRMYLHVTETLGVAAERCVYVGDGNSHELRGARALGMTTVWVDNGADQEWKSNFDHRADHTVTGLEEVLDLLPHTGRR